MDPYSSPFITHYKTFHVLFHSSIPSQPKARLQATRHPPALDTSRVFSERYFRLQVAAKTLPLTAASPALVVSEPSKLRGQWKA